MKLNTFYLIIFTSSLATATNKTPENHAQIIAKQEKIIKAAYAKHLNMIKQKTPSVSQSKQLASSLPEPKDIADQKLVEKFKTILEKSEHARLATKEISTLVNKNSLKSESELQEHKKLVHQKALKTVHEVQTLHAKIQKKSKFYKKPIAVAPMAKTTPAVKDKLVVKPSSVIKVKPVEKTILVEKPTPAKVSPEIKKINPVVKASTVKDKLIKTDDKKVNNSKIKKIESTTNKEVKNDKK